MKIIGELIGKGNTAEVYKLEDNKVIKLFLLNHPQSAIEREYRINMAINNLHLAPIFIGKTEENGRIGFIYEYIHGSTMLQAIAHHPWKIVVYSKLLAKIHTEIQKHSVSGLST